MQPAHLDLEKLSSCSGGKLVTRLNENPNLDAVRDFIQILEPQLAVEFQDSRRMRMSSAAAWGRRAPRRETK